MPKSLLIGMGFVGAVSVNPRGDSDRARRGIRPPSCRALRPHTGQLGAIHHEPPEQPALPLRRHHTRVLHRSHHGRIPEGLLLAPWHDALLGQARVCWHVHIGERVRAGLRPQESQRRGLEDLPTPRNIDRGACAADRGGFAPEVVCYASEGGGEATIDFVRKPIVSLRRGGVSTFPACTRCSSSSST